jgi:hypothetical protein
MSANRFGLRTTWSNKLAWIHVIVITAGMNNYVSPEMGQPRAVLTESLALGRTIDKEDTVCLSLPSEIKRKS